MAAQLDALASNETDSPVVGALGEYVNAAVGAGGELTMAVATDVAEVDPPAFAALTTDRMVLPTSVLASV